MTVQEIKEVLLSTHLSKEARESLMKHGPILIAISDIEAIAIAIHAAL